MTHDKGNQMKVRIKYDLELGGKTLTMKQAGVKEVMEIPDNIEESEISDWISDKTGWCVIDWMKINN